MSFNECKLMLNNVDSKSTLSDQFFDFVFKKISNKRANRFVEKDAFSIDIIPASHDPIKIIPIFKDMDKDKLELKDEIEIASKIMQNSDIKYIYFVYPRNNNFDKHIEVKIPKLENEPDEYLIKIIPYSLRDLYKKGINNGNCNILCK